MTQSPKPCSRCRGPMKPVTLAAFAGEDHGVRVTVDGMPALACEEGHRRFLHAAFGAQLMDMLGDALGNADVPAGVKKGLLFKHYHCTSCGGELEADASGLASRSFRPQFDGGPAFDVQVELPLWKCAGCGEEQSHPPEEMSSLAIKALAHGFRAVDVHPE